MRSISAMLRLSLVSEWEEVLKQLSDIQIDGIRRRVKSTLDYLESEHITKHDPDYQLSSVEIGITLVLAEVAELLPPPLYEDVKRLLGIRERLWHERYSPGEQKAQKEGGQL